MERKKESIKPSKSGLICLNWYDWNGSRYSLVCRSLFSSGLICLNWYDWNLIEVSCRGYVKHSSGLICLNWYDWNVSLVKCKNHYLWMSGLICLNWYDWNIPTMSVSWMFLLIVGIDLPELIRLKRYQKKKKLCWKNSTSRDWSAWIDTIETFHNKLSRFPLLHRRDWSAWIDTIETRPGI